MNEIFSCLACYSQKVNFFCSEIKAKINTSSVKGSGKDKIGKKFLKIGIYVPLSPILAFDHSQIIIL